MNSARQFQKSKFNQLMDKENINGLIQNTRKLNYKFCCWFAAKKFLWKVEWNSFYIVNASSSNSPGTHWLIIFNRNSKIGFAYTLRQSILAYKYLCHRFSSERKNAQYPNFSNINQFRSKTWNCLDFFVLILRMLYLVKDIFFKKIR